jgi:hypothetical protein
MYPYDLLRLEVTKEMAEIDVEQIPPFRNHDVIGMSVTNAEHECCDTIATTSKLTEKSKS